MAHLLNKLSWKTSGAKESLVVMGMATAMKTGRTQYGDFVGFRGDFLGFADDRADEPLKSGVCFLPAVATDLLVAAMEADGATGVEFAFRITQVEADNAVGYEYRVEPLTESKSPVDALAEKIKARLAALPAPAKGKAK